MTHDARRTVDPFEPALRVLGAVQVASTRGAIPLGRERMRALLALLAVEPGRELSLATLSADLAPGPDLPLDPGSVRTYLSRLRARLAAADGRVTIPDATERGYCLLVESSDHTELLSLAATAERWAGEGDLEAAARDCDRALALWRGRPFGDLDLTALDLPRSRLEATHLRVEELRISVGLDLGDHERLVPDIEAAVAREPLREERTRYLMLALYRSGQQRRALAAAHALRRRLADAGLDAPSPSILDVERRILDHDPGLVVPEERRRVAAIGARSRRPAPRWGRVTDFVAREDEIDRLVAVTTPTDRPGPVAALVEADPGMGKTALLGEVVARVEALGGVVVPARCPPMVHGPFEVVERLAHEIDDPALAVAVVPDEEHRLPFDEQVLVVADALRTSLHELSARHGACSLVVDDAHWIDAGSAAVLARLADLAPPGCALVVAARHHGNQSWRLLRDAIRSTVTTVTVAIGAFSETELAGVLAARSVPADAATVSRVHRATGGHPLLVASLLDSGLDVDAVPASIAEWAADQVRALPDASADVVRTLAVLRATPSLHKVAAAAGVSVDAAAEALAHPACRHLVVEDLDERRAIRLRHEMVAQVIRATLAPGDAARTHRRAMRWEDDVGGRPLQAGWHALGAASVLPWDEVDAHLTSAARHGLALGLFDQVVELCEAVDRRGVGPDRTPLDLQVLHAAARQELGDRPGAIDLFWTALSAAQESGSVARVADIADRVAQWAGSYVGEPKAMALIGVARQHLEGRDDAAAARIRRVELIQMVMQRGPSPERRAELDALPRSTPQDEISHLRAQLYLDAGSPDPSVRIRRADALRRGLAAVDDTSRVVALDASFFRLCGLLLAGARPEDVAVEREQLRALVAESRTPTFVWLDMVVDHDTAQDAGRFDEAVALARRAREYGRAHGLPDSEASYMGLCFVVGVLRDDLVVEEDGGPLDLGDAFEQLAEVEPDAAVWHATAGLARLRRGDRDGADAAVRRAVERIGASDGHHLNPLSTVLVAQATGELRCPDLAAVVEPVLAPYAGTCPRMGQAGATLGPADRLLGTLVGVRGDVAAALPLLERALDHARRRDQRPWVALTLHELAHLSDGDEARRMKKEADAIASGVGLHLPTLPAPPRT